jgi:sodium/bile acid cotransporter 7
MSFTCMHVKKYGFLYALFLSVLAGLKSPDFGVNLSHQFGLSLTHLAIWLIFLRQGLALPSEDLLRGRHPIRLHAFVLSWNFLIFPLVTTALVLSAGLWIGPDLQLGFYLLSILPTTIASAIALTAASGGNTAKAIFSTVYSNLFAVFWVPIAGLFFLGISSGSQISLLPVISQLGLLIALPLLIGQLTQHILPKFAVTVSSKTTWLCPGLILWLVYNAFAKSTQSGGLDQLTPTQLITTVLCSALLLLLVSGMVWWSQRWLQIENDCRPAAFFCASQKSLATGLPLLATLLAGSGLAEIPAILYVPILVYHSLQLLLGSVLLRFFEKLD